MLLVSGEERLVLRVDVFEVNPEEAKPTTRLVAQTALLVADGESVSCQAGLGGPESPYTFRLGVSPSLTESHRVRLDAVAETKGATVEGRSIHTVVELHEGEALTLAGLTPSLPPAPTSLLRRLWGQVPLRRELLVQVTPERSK